MGIDRTALIAADFDTDEFLSARRHLPLEELKSQVRENTRSQGKRRREIWRALIEENGHMGNRLTFVVFLLLPLPCFLSLSRI